MCGIAGIVGSAATDVVDAMCEAMRRRGPDDAGVYADPAAGVALGHRRLSILDLTPAGHQPMGDASGRYWVVLSGEIYNFRELRQELENAGHAFRSQTDTEVLLNGYREWGRAVLLRLRGMFAFALLDRGPAFGPDPNNQDGLPAAPAVLLARDRLGIKPLVVLSDPRRFPLRFGVERVAGLRDDRTRS